MMRLSLTNKDAELIAEALECAIDDSYTNKEIWCKAPRMNQIRNSILEAVSDKDAGRREREPRGFDEYIKENHNPEPDKTESLFSRIEKIAALARKQAETEPGESGSREVWNNISKDLENAAQFISKAVEAKRNIIVLRGFLDDPDPVAPLSTEPKYKYFFPDPDELPF